jgi:hypothetical protein
MRLIDNLRLLLMPAAAEAVTKRAREAEDGKEKEKFLINYVKSLLPIKCGAMID